MARTWQEIYNEMATAVQAKASFNTLEPSDENASKFLEDIKSTSKVAVWRAFLFIISVYHYLQELLFDDHISEVEETISKGQYGTASWWEQKVLEFQYGNQVVEQDGAIVYDPIDENARIVTVVAVSRTSGSIELKVAKGDLASLVPLTFPEKAGLASYASRIKPVGEDVLIVSQAADLLKLNAVVYYDASIGLATVQTNVESAIDGYLSQLKFAGVFVKNTMIDKVQAVEGVADIQINTLEAKDIDGVYVSIERAYDSKAGYMKVDDSFPLSSELTYIAN